ncbi:MAG: Hpt domain-containing protein [Chloroflexota bacterium]
MPTSDLVNANEIRQLAAEMGDGAAEIISDLVDSLERDITRSLGEMRDALQQNDPKRLRQAAHRLYGSFVSLGARKAASSCRELEMVGESGDIGHTAPMVERLEGLCSESIQALREFPL